MPINVFRFEDPGMFPAPPSPRVTKSSPTKRLAPLLRPAFAWNHRWTTPREEAGLRAFLAERRQRGAP